VTAGRTLIRRYALVLIPAGAGNEAAVTATSVPPLSGGTGEHGSEATHVFTIADSVGGVGGRRRGPGIGQSGFPSRRSRWQFMADAVRGGGIRGV
jgi:hypothetical protein